MKLIFEETQKQINNLLELVNTENTLTPKEFPNLRDDYQMGNLWQVKDVQSKYACEKDDALSLLQSALSNEATMNQVWAAIEHHAEDQGIEKIEDVDLFEHYYLLPDNVNEILLKYGDEGAHTYKRCQELLKELEPLGYTFEYGLDACPFDLKIIEE